MPITLLTLEEAAERYQLPLEQLRRLMETGRITVVTVNGDTLVNDEEVCRVAGSSGNHLHWVTLKEAARQHALDEALLERLARDGLIRSTTLGEDLLLVDEDVGPIAARFAEANFRHLRGIPISMSAAARKYGFPVGSIFNWVRKGYIEVIERGTKTVCIDEADIAYARALAEVRGVRRSRALFPASAQYRPTVSSR